MVGGTMTGWSLGFQTGSDGSLQQLAQNEVLHSQSSFVLRKNSKTSLSCSRAFRTGVLTALMGVSGAGKTKLMDVLAGRKTGGYIDGSIKISGYPKKQEMFAKISGYCELNDIHSSYVTVYESLVYSAWLQLPQDVDEHKRRMFVEEVMDLVELTPLRLALVGLPEVNELVVLSELHNPRKTIREVSVQEKSVDCLLGLGYAGSQALPDVGLSPPRDTFYLHAQDGQAIFTRLCLSAFEAAILLVRAFYLAILFSPSIAMAPYADILGLRFRKIWLQVVHRSLERAGPAFIKWGQWAATRPDLFPRDLCAELSKLHSKAPEHSFAYTKKIVEKAFGRKLSEIFDEFEQNPVASGSIAQVHRASLKYRYRGREIKKPIEVAVKVRHPGVGESIRRDFEIINIVAKISGLIPSLKWLRLDESVQQFAVFMMSQVDLAREAAHLSRFIYNFRRWKDVSFPKPVYPLVHPAVLVETFEEGESVAHYVDELEGHERLKSSLAHIGTHALLKMLLVDNFMHADMHPGNILVRVPQHKSSRKRIFKSKPHVIFLDVGMTAELSQNDKLNLLEFFKAVARRDGRTAAECTLSLSKKQNCPNPEDFIKEVKESFDFWGTPEGDVVHPADCMMQLLEQVRRHKVNIDGNVCTAMVTTLVLEGWQRKLDPDYNIMHTLQTLLLKADWAKDLSYTIEQVMAP